MVFFGHRDDGQWAPIADTEILLKDGGTSLGLAEGLPSARKTFRGISLHGHMWVGIHYHTLLVNAYKHFRWLPWAEHHGRCAGVKCPDTSVDIVGELAVARTGHTVGLAPNHIVDYCTPNS